VQNVRTFYWKSYESYCFLMDTWCLLWGNIPVFKYSLILVVNFFECRLSLLFVKIAVCSRPDLLTLKWRHTSAPLHPPWRLSEWMTNVRFEVQNQLFVQRFHKPPFGRQHSAATSCEDSAELHVSVLLRWSAKSANRRGLMCFARCPPVLWQAYYGFSQCLHTHFQAKSPENDQ
jgi:hypothetical protein